MSADSTCNARSQWRTAIVMLLFIGSFFVVRPLWHHFALDGVARYPVLLIPVVMTIVFVRTMMAQARAAGTINPAVARYLRDLLICILAYMALLILANLARETLDPRGLAGLALHVLPIVPMLLCVGVMGRYLAHEPDEYQRMLAVRSSLFATGLLLAVALVWEPLRDAGLVGPAKTGFAFVIWCAGLGLGQLAQRLRP